jgi:hypothetical protein
MNMADTTTPTAPEQQGDVITAPPPKPKTPLDPPQLYYNLKWHVTPLIIRFQEDADALDPAEWTTIPPAAKSAEAKFPKLYYDVNVPPLLVATADDLKTIDTSRYKEFVLSKGLLDAAQANLEAAEQPAG